MLDTWFNNSCFIKSFSLIQTLLSIYYCTIYLNLITKNVVFTTGIGMKPKLEDVLFLNSSLDDIVERKVPNRKKISKSVVSIEKYSKNLKKLLFEEFSNENIEEIIIDELKGPYFLGYIKYFNSNYIDSLDKSKKNVQKSVEARIQANGLLSKKGHDTQAHNKIWELCCKSIAFASIGSKDLILAYECRSNLLLHLKKYADCVKDIDRALALTEFHPLTVKLLCRKMICFVEMDKTIDEKENLWLTLKYHFEKTDAVFKDERFLKIFKQARNNSYSQSSLTTKEEERCMIPSVSHSNVSTMFNKGKHILVANQDFVPGDIIVVEKPIVTSANPDQYYAYCSHCLSFMWAGIPCNECTLCMYCSEECKIQAWEKYHYLECCILPHLNFDNGIYYEFQGSIRLFIMGLKEFGSISKLKEQILNIDKLRDNSKSVKNGKLFDSDFLNIYISPLIPMLKSSLNIVKQYTKHACFLMAYIIQTCDIFEKDMKSIRGKQLVRDKILVDLGFVMFKLLACIQHTLHPIQVHLQVPKCPHHKGDNRCCLKGKIFDPLRAMFEKSCNPNTSVCWTDDGKLIYYCVQPVQRMEKLTFSCNEFFKSKLRQREAWCGKCSACIKDWPLMSELFKKYEQRLKKRKTLDTELIEKYLKKNELTTAFVDEKNCVFTFEEFEQLKKDVNNIVTVYGQPSFASSLMISFLCKTVEKFYATIPLQSHIPADC